MGIFSPSVLSPFFRKCVTGRRVLVYDLNTARPKAETRNPEQMRAMSDTSRSRSASPTKRQRSASGRPGNRAAVFGEDTFDHVLEYDSQADSGFLEEASASRGRSRKRKYEWDDGERTKVARKRQGE